MYIKEEAVVPGLDSWLAGLFDDEHLDTTWEVLAGAAEPDPDYEARQYDLEARIRDCDRRLARYREALEHVEGEVIPVARWIAEVQRERRNLEAQLGRELPGGKLTTAQVKGLVAALRDIVGVLAEADPADKAELYGELGVSLTYHPDGADC